MKVFIFQLAFLIVLLCFLPYAIVFRNGYKENFESTKELSVYMHKSGEVRTMNIDEYLTGVVSAEMPASFSHEALKAQAVAARTYALRKKGADPAHKGADVCTDFAHCQAYVSKEQCQKNWGKNYRKYMKKISSAVKSTTDECLFYNGDYAITVFHSCSNGITEKASDVWGGDIDYLVNVRSPGDLKKNDYINRVVFSKADFVAQLEKYLQKKIDTNETAIGDVSYTSGENVSHMTIYGNSIKGTDIRKIFSLKSTSFQLEFKEEVFTFITYGNGHGVGMSQYGADDMAKENKSYTDILYHYYPGTKIMKVNN